MSRYLVSGTDEKGLWFIETLTDANGCRYLVNEVCCNADSKDTLADFPDEDCCKNCKYFVRETQADIEKYKVGVKTRE